MAIDTEHPSLPNSRARQSATPKYSDYLVSGGPFALLIGYMTIEWIRPQSFVPQIGILRPSLSLMILLGFYWVRRWGFRPLLDDRLLALYTTFCLFAVAWIPFTVNNNASYAGAEAFVMTLVASTIPASCMLVSPKRRDQYVLFMLIAFCYLAAYAMTHRGRGPGSFITDENDLALVLCMGVAFPYFMAQQSSIGMGKRLGYYGIVLLLLGGIVSTNSRGGFVGLVCVVSYMLWLSKNKARNLAVCLILGVIAVQFVPDSYVEEIQTISDPTENTANERLVQWRIAWEMFIHNPVLGVGTRNYAWRAPEYQRQLDSYQPGDRGFGGRVAHSLYFTLLSEFGLVGVVLYGLIVIGLLRRLKYCEGTLNSLSGDGDPDGELERSILLTKAIRASAIGYLAAGAFITVLYYPSLWFLVALTVALSRDVQIRLAAKTPAVRRQLTR